MNAQDFLTTFGRLAKSAKEKGYLFERLTKEWLQNVPPHCHEFAQVQLWREWAVKQNIDQTDTGIDLVARTHDGDYCAIQCKFFHPKNRLEKADIDSFFTAAGQNWGGIEFDQLKIVSTTPDWSKHAENALTRRKVQCTRIDFADELSAADIDWGAVKAMLPYAPDEETNWEIESAQTEIAISDQLPVQINLKKLLAKIIPAAAKPGGEKKPHSYQETAIKDVVSGFKEADRGKLVMACGTGKTFVSLKIAEKIAADGGNVLFLVPSIALLSQTLREWSAQSARPLRNFAVCSDVKTGRDDEDIPVHDLAIPATTDSKKLADKLKQSSGGRTNAVFSTYHSIDVVAEAQQHGAPEFDLIICDEAHRTTGVEGGGKKQSYFTKVHDNECLRGRKRLYMTATPRIYSQSAKNRAKDHDVDVFSMDDPENYGNEFHRLDFSKAVSQRLLSDYKVLILAVDEEHVSRAMQAEFAGKGELNLSDAAKIIGCWNGLAKQIKNAEEGGITDAAPMRRAVAFAQSIKVSDRVAKNFTATVAKYIERNPQEDALRCEVKHVDGTQNALMRNQALQWLKQEPQGNGCHILSNVRCLSEGVDVPALDAVMFLNPRESQVEIVQSVGRVMRKAADKDYGYIILPIGVDANVRPEDALNDNKKYRVVWQVLQALRAHDDRLNAEINKIELNKNKAVSIDVIGVGFDNGDAGASDRLTGLTQLIPEDLEEWRGAIYAKMVLKCGDRQYWETWAKNVADIAGRSTIRIKTLLAGSEKKYRESFNAFLAELQQNLNPVVTEAAAIEMLAQHMITRPIFNALFGNSDFVAKNPVSKAMQSMLALLDEQNLARETGGLKKFYESVAQCAEGIDNSEGRQKIVVELYDKFFRTAFPKMAKSLGIVYTPVEVVDFIIHSTEYLLQKEFGKGMTSKDVHILDPFTGTGTFITRLLQSDVIDAADLKRKYEKEIHANEVVLLAYYIAAVNIEQAYQQRQTGAASYRPFEGIALTDTFQINERDGDIINKVFPVNSARVQRQKDAPIRAVFGNPPYSVGQKNANDANKNLKYEKLDARIRETYAAHSTANLRRNLYDSYIRAIRWSSDRIGDEGIVSFITNSSYIDGSAMDGLRKCLCDDFSSIHCLNLRGNVNMSMKNESSGEGGNIFGQESKTGIAILFLIKKPPQKSGCKLHYCDIGNNLTTAEKLEKLSKWGSIAQLTWDAIIPDQHVDWINQRDPVFDSYLPMGVDGNRKKGAPESPSVFLSYSNGLSTNRDAWVYGYAVKKVARNMQAMIAFYNSEAQRYQQAGAEGGTPSKISDFVNNDSTKIKWSSKLEKSLKKGEIAAFAKSKFRVVSYRPFSKQHLYFDGMFLERPAIANRYFPQPDTKNLSIYVAGTSAVTDFSALMVDTVPNLHFLDSGQCFPRHRYEKTSGKNADLLGESGGLRRIDNIPPATVSAFQSHYKDASIDGDSIFYYVYGVLHNETYKSRFAANLKKSLPRIPHAKNAADFRAFSEAGEKLANLHVNYETVKPYPLVSREQNATGGAGYFKVSKMAYAGDSNPAKSIIQYNANITLEKIPPEAHQYIVNGKTALGWVIDRYQVKTDSTKSKITNDPNDWSDDPRYIIDLICKVVTVSVETVKIVRTLPDLP